MLMDPATLAQSLGRPPQNKALLTLFLRVVPFVGQAKRIQTALHQGLRRL